MAIVVSASVGLRYAAAEWARTRAQEFVPAPLASVRTVSLREGLIHSAVRYSGIVKELRKSELSFRVAGTVETLHQMPAPGNRQRAIHAGDEVPNRTSLAQLDPADFERDLTVANERLAAAVARRVQAAADRDLAERDRERADQLFKKHVLTAAEHDAAVTRESAAKAAERAAEREAEGARAARSQAEANVRYCTLEAPFAVSTVAERAVDVGQRVTVGQRAFVVLDLSSVVVSFSVPDVAVGRLHMGEELEVTTDAFAGEVFRGVVHRIDSKADEQTRTYTVEVRIDEPRGLRPGMVASVHVRKEQRGEFLPVTALSTGSTAGEFVVYRLRPRGDELVLESVPVRVTGVVDGRAAVEPSGGAEFRGGDAYVRDGVHRLRDGQVVQRAAETEPTGGREVSR